MTTTTFGTPIAAFAQELPNGKYTFWLTDEAGRCETIKKAGALKHVVQLYARDCNGNGKAGTLAARVTFGKTIPSYLVDIHTRTLPVTLVEAAA